jgi:hypothetical protein
MLAMQVRLRFATPMLWIIGTAGAVHIAHDSIASIKGGTCSTDLAHVLHQIGFQVRLDLELVVVELRDHVGRVVSGGERRHSGAAFSGAASSEVSRGEDWERGDQQLADGNPDLGGASEYSQVMPGLTPK